MHFRSCRATRNIKHHQQFHQMIVGWLRQRLHNIDATITYGRAKLNKEIVVAEPGDVCTIQRHTEFAGDVRSQGLIRTSAEKTNFFCWNWGIGHFDFLTWKLF